MQEFPFVVFFSFECLRLSVYGERDIDEVEILKCL